MGDFHYIVDKLNQPPFSYSLSLLSFRSVKPSKACPPQNSYAFTEA
jgi:hypothetical protein